MTMGDIISQHKPRELNKEYDVYTLSREHNISCQGYNGMTLEWSLKLMPNIGDFWTYVET